ncbi:MAG TPA: pentapeptide repeat-containing protein [Streptosporangiaceae bacterium]|nr:pentapeptide repeat-containing protein [Streptosporangiaceae bacterium]
MTLRSLRPVVLIAATLLGASAVLLPISATAALAASCPTVASNGTVSPSPSTGVDWSGCDLANANLKNAALTDANLANANLTGAVLAGANLSMASIANATMTNTDLSSADLDSANLGAVFTNCHLADADLNKADMSNSLLFNVSSGGIVGTPAKLPFAYSLIDGFLVGQDANLTSADLSGADLSGDNLTSVNFTNTNLTSANLASALLESANLQTTNLTNANLNGANLTSAGIKDATLSGTILTGASLGALSSEGNKGTPASLPANWTIVNGYLLGPTAVISRATLGNANLSNVDLSDATLENAIFTKSNLTGANLSDADMQFATFSTTNLTGANITGANFEFASWSNTTCPDGTSSEQHAPDSCVTSLDSSPPVAAPAVAVGTANAAGWYHTPVTVAWNWTDDGTINQAQCTQASATTTDGNSVTLAATCQDMNGNVGHSTFGVKVDTTPPEVTVRGVATNGEYVLGAVPAAGCKTSDSLSGIAVTATPKITTTGSHGVGPFVATCAGAVDVAGNPQSKPVSRSYVVIDGFGGFASPKQGATLPKSARTIVVTFRLVNAAGKPISSAAALAAAKDGHLLATLAGPGIARTSATCGWIAKNELFSCAIKTPKGVETGSAKNYTLAVAENVGTGLIRARPVGTAINPETVHFKAH